MHRVFPTVFLAATLFAAPLHAGFVLDDFDDPAVTVGPAMTNEFVFTPNVGALNASREIRIAGTQGNPIGQLDADLTNRSVLTGTITELNPTPFGNTIASVQSNYDFVPSDFTENGTNNAFFFDFRELTSELPPSLFKILLTDTTITHYAYLSRVVPRNSEEFTMTVPFSDFTERGGSPGLPNYETIASLSFSVRPSRLFGGGPEPLNFHMQLDRIRVGRIPEPSTAGAACVSLLILTGWFRFF